MLEILSPALLAKLERVINRPKFDAMLTRSATSRDQSLAELRQLAELIEPAPCRNRCAAIPMTMPSLSAIGARLE